MLSGRPPGDPRSTETMGLRQGCAPRWGGLRAVTPHPWSATGTVDLIASPLAQMSASPATIRRPPPMLGEHNAEVLHELGYDDARIAELKELKIL